MPELVPQVFQQKSIRKSFFPANYRDDSKSAPNFNIASPARNRVHEPGATFPRMFRDQLQLQNRPAAGTASFSTQWPLLRGTANDDTRAARHLFSLLFFTLGRPAKKKIFLLCEESMPHAIRKFLGKHRGRTASYDRRRNGHRS